MPTAKPRQRAPQKRAEETKEAILNAGVELFSTQGFEGVSVRAIEEASQTKRGLVAYHFDSKEVLWKAVAKRIFENLPGLPPAAEAALQGLSKEAQIRAHMTAFIQHSAAHPEISRLIIQEGKAQTWRLEYLVENCVRPRVRWMEKLMGTLDAHTMYIFIGAATLVFDVEAECESLFGFNPREEAFVNAHANKVCDLLLNGLLKGGLN